MPGTEDKDHSFNYAPDSLMLFLLKYHSFQSWKGESGGLGTFSIRLVFLWL